MHVSPNMDVRKRNSKIFKSRTKNYVKPSSVPFFCPLFCRVTYVPLSLTHAYSEGSKEIQGTLEETSEKLEKAKKTLDDLGQSKRKTGSVFISIVMGHVSVRLWNQGDRLQFKQEYNRFKEKMIWLFVFFPVWQAYWGFSMAVHQIQSLFLFYYYASMAIRENILSLNGLVPAFVL